jgi:hypothetical protein
VQELPGYFVTELIMLARGLCAQDKQYYSLKIHSYIIILSIDELAQKHKNYTTENKPLYISGIRLWQALYNLPYQFTAR